MRLSQIVEEYLVYKHALGFRLVGDDYILRSFSRRFERTPLAAVRADRVCAFLRKGQTSQETVARKHRALAGLYRYIRGRYGDVLPALPRLNATRKDSSDFIPYIYSHEELKKLLQMTTPICQHPQQLLEASTLRAILLLLYGAGLRLGEALALNIEDVDFEAALLTIRRSKFYKSRLVAVGKDLKQVLITYRQQRDERHSREPDRPFFCLRDGRRVYRQCIQYNFRRLRAAAKIGRDGGPRRQPRLHDLRHSAAVHRLIAWYRSGTDVQELLPRLSTFLGHKNLSGTQRYLTLTPQLMRLASQRFHHYALGGTTHA
jgi:site-specific recombinase XerD